MIELSVVLLSRNQAKSLSRSLLSLARDRNAIQQLVLIDDASSDDTAQVIDSLSNRLPPHEVVRRPVRTGAIENLVEGLRRSTGRYVFFLAADDDVLPGFLDRTLTLLRANPQAGLCSSRSRLIDAAGNDHGVFDTPCPLFSEGFIPSEACKSALALHGSWFMGNATLFRREALEKVGGFDIDLGGFADAYACLAIALRQGACFIPDALAAKRAIETGMGSRIYEDALKSISIWRQVRRRLEVEHSPPYDKALLDRMETRWRFEIARSYWRRKLDWGDRDKIAAHIFKFLFFIVRFCLVFRYKPFDALQAIRRRVA